jgi:hypothetical protein
MHHMDKKYERIVLEKFKLRARQISTYEFIKSAGVEVWADFVACSLISQMDAFVSGQQVKYIEIDYPLTWWQALKKELYEKRWFPERIKRRWPVKSRTRTIDIKLLYPDLVIPDQRIMFPVIFHRGPEKGYREHGP